MITGLALGIGGLFLFLHGSFSFNMGFMLLGWVIGVGGAFVFASHVVWLP